LDRLIKNKVIYFRMDVDLSKATNHIIYVMGVELETGIKKEKIYNEITSKFSNIWGVIGPV